MEIVQSGINLVGASPIASNGFIPIMPRFLAFDPQEFDGLMKKYKSLSVKKWVVGNIWRWNLNLDYNDPLEDLLFPILFEMLCKFFQMVCKLENSLCPLASLMNFHMSDLMSIHVPHMLVNQNSK